MVPAPHAFKTDGFQRPIFTRGGGSSAPRRRFQRPIFAGDSGSSASCLQDRWVPAPNFYEGRWFQRPTASVPAPNFYEGLWFQRLMPSRQMGTSAQFSRGTVVPAGHGVGSSAQILRGTMVPAAHACKTDGLQRPSFARDGGSSRPRRGFQHSTVTGRLADLPICRPADSPTCRAGVLPTCQPAYLPAC